MTGHEHYDKAEELLRQAEVDVLGSPEEAYDLAAAQVHATLALVDVTKLVADKVEGS